MIILKHRLELRKERERREYESKLEMLKDDLTNHLKSSSEEEYIYSQPIKKFGHLRINENGEYCFTDVGDIENETIENIDLPIINDEGELEHPEPKPQRQLYKIGNSTIQDIQNVKEDILLPQLSINEINVIRNRYSIKHDVTKEQLDVLSAIEFYKIISALFNIRRFDLLKYTTREFINILNDPENIEMINETLDQYALLLDNNDSKETKLICEEVIRTQINSSDSAIKESKNIENISFAKLLIALRQCLKRDLYMFE